MSLTEYDVFLVGEITERVIKAIEGAPFGLFRVKRVKNDLEDVLGRVRFLCESAEELMADKNNTLLASQEMAAERIALRCRNEMLEKQLAEKEAQYADAVSRWAGLARLWQEEHGGGLVYVTSEERKAEGNENVALGAAAVSAGCAAEGTETGADCDPPELAGQGNAGASAGEQGDGIPKG